MKILVQIARFIVGITFIFSGFVKMVDPIGSAYKFEEYFSAAVLNLEFMIPYALPFAIVLILIETLLGVMLLLGYLPKFTVFSLLGLILVFLFLTWYSAYYNKVTDCGCFGDAVKLSTWETFYKNIVFGVLILLLVLKWKLIKPLLNESFVKWISFLSLFSFLYITYYVLVHLPLIDFRPFAVGKSIKEGMQFKGEEAPVIHDFYLESVEGEVFTDVVLNENKVMLIVAYNLFKTDKEGFVTIKYVTDRALDNGYKVYMLTSSWFDEFELIKQENKLNFDMLFGDETMLKTIIRSNPGIVVLEHGVVTGKWSWNDAHKIVLN